jgi:hypothetical protein
MSSLSLLPINKKQFSWLLFTAIVPVLFTCTGSHYVYEWILKLSSMQRERLRVYFSVGYEEGCSPVWQSGS